MTALSGQLKSICQDYYKKINDLESKKWDIEYEIKKKDMEVRATLRYLRCAMLASEGVFQNWTS